MIFVMNPNFNFYIFDFFQLAKLPPEDMNAVHNLRLLGGSSDTKKSSTGAFSLKFDMHKVITIVLVCMWL